MPQRVLNLLLALVVAGTGGWALSFIPQMTAAGAAAAGVVEADDSACRLCHPVEAEEWTASAHARSLQAIQGRAGAGEQCLPCHGAEAFLAELKKDARRPALEQAQHGVNCLVCHTAHEERTDPADRSQILRLAPDRLCATCHALERVDLDRRPHHNQQQMYGGGGALNGGRFPSPMAQLGVTCAHCHLPVKLPAGEAKGRPTRGHNVGAFQPGREGQPDGCTYCHRSFTAAFLARDIEQKQATTQKLLARVERLLAEKENFKAQPQYQRARYNYEFVLGDRSLGFHNPLYASILLESAAEALQQLK
ncbi:MAG: ammonia-forming cytochrome c nitrite reductase subunit c552 [Bacillota bacterium]|nr:ammonia-forming cytochrome c nitrite reductase subunit c552 [Bacillota bacterium]